MTDVIEQTDWLDGPGLARWLDGQVTKGDLGDKGPLGASLAKRIREWRTGVKANVYVVDEIMVRLGLSISHLPDELYVPPPKVGSRPGTTWLTDDQRAEIRRLAAVPRGYRSGTYLEIARQFGISERRVRQIASGN